MKIWIHEPVMAADTSALVSKVKRFVDKLFGGLDRALETIESWVDDDEDQSDGPVDTTIRFELIPASDNKDRDTSPIFQLTAKKIDENDRYATIRYDLKSKDGNSTTDTAKLYKPKEGESDSECQDRVKTMLYDMSGQMLSDLTDGEFDQVADIREA